MTSPSALDVQQLSQLVLVCAGLVGLVLGAASQASRFCTQGAFTDLMLMGSRFRLAQWVWAMTVAMLLSQLLAAAGMLPLQASLYTSSRLLWAGHLLGGLLFGLGMVLASGCGAKTLVRIGEGSLKAVVVLLTMSMAALASLKGLLALLRSQTFDRVAWQLPSSQDLPSLMGHGLTAQGLIDPALSPGPWVRILIASALALLMGLWVWRHRHQGHPARLWLGASLIGLTVPASWLLTGVLGFLPEHPETLAPAYLATASRGPEAPSYVAPMGQMLELLVYGSDQSLRLSYGVALALGTVAGAHLMARLRGQFRWEGFQSLVDLRNHLLGGALMGLGGITALGCTIGQGLSGVSTLSLGAVLSLLGLFAGARLGLVVLSRA